MKKTSKIIFLIVVLQVFLHIIIAVPVIILFAKRIESGSLIEGIISSIIFTVSFLLALIILKVKNKDMNFSYLGVKIASIYFAFGLTSLLFNDVDFLKIIIYPLLVVLISSIYFKRFL